MLTPQGVDRYVWGAREASLSNMEVAVGMRLVRLTLSGFKSFADRTEFSFDEAVIGVVGPNGCGKSNIVDSIKWVLGERSSKSLRGKEMIDVIFAGSAGRKPSGMAAVSLTFENPVINASAAMVELQYGDHIETVDGEPADGPAADGQLATGNGQLAEHAEAAPESGDTSSLRLSVSLSLPDDSPAHLLTCSPAHPSGRRRALPIDADTVEVERRLFRDGTSQYLINGKRARLRDIRDLFLDTGIGADAYSIIEQGKVDAMLLASPQERRIIFEEAAGIAKYKQRRIEAQRKLERAQANLALTRQQLESTERRLRLVRNQAAKARRFRELDQDLRAWRMAVAFELYDDVRKRVDGLTSRLAELEGIRAKAIEAVTRLEHAKQEAEVQRHEVSARHRAAEEQRLSAEHARESAIQRRQMTERALGEARSQADADGRRLAELDALIEGLTASIRAAAEQAAAISETLDEADRRVEEAAGARAEAQQRLADAGAALGHKRGAVADIEREHAALAAGVEADQRRADGLRDELARLAERISGLDAERARLTTGAEAAADALTARRCAAESLDGRLADRERAAESLSEGRREVAARAGALEQRHLRLDARRHTLHEMIESREGLGDAVRDALARRAAGAGFTGVIAPLAEMIWTDAAHAPAVEVALGQTLQALVVESQEALPRPDELASLKGRVTFLTLSGPGSNRTIPCRITGRASFLSLSRPSSAAAPLLSDPFRDTPGVIALRRVVRARAGDPSPPDRDPGVAAAPVDGIDALLDRLLGSAYLVDDLDTAMRLAPVAPDARFVTRRGEVLEPDGRVCAGPPGVADAAGVLQRRSELSGLEQDLAALWADLARERAALEALDAEAAAINAQQTELRSQSAAEHRGIAADQARLEQLHAEAERLDRQRADLHDQMQVHAGRLGWLEGDLAQRRERCGGLSRLLDDERAAAAALQESVRLAQAASDEQSERLTAAKIEAGRLAEQVGAARREHRRLIADGEHAASQRRGLGELVERSIGRVIEHEHTLAECATQIERAAADAAQFADLGASLAETARASEERVRDLGERTGAARQHAQGVERDWHALEVSRREVEVKRESMEERASEDLRLDLAFEYADYRAMMAEGGVARIDPARAAAEIETLRTEIARLGSVNLDAIDEEAQLAQRNEDLVRQVADIDDAAKKLADLIEHLNTASRERFGEIFARIQEHFAGPSGMFRKLFGGGKAEVRLMPMVKEVETAQGVQRVETDQIDLLESGIEVIAKPPGKEPRSISQLSGGEKTLTAVALLLAIFQSKPSCFCILDEVDAALDDANVGRFCDVVRQFTAHSHFIVITHNKKTMQATDRLYGVTMQERGVSTRVSVKFEHVGANGEVHTAEASTPRARRAGEGSSANGEAGNVNGEVEAKPKPARRRLPSLEQTPFAEN